jgi:hypothetical protein
MMHGEGRIEGGKIIVDSLCFVSIPTALYATCQMRRNMSHHTTYTPTPPHAPSPFDRSPKNPSLTASNCAAQKMLITNLHRVLPLSSCVIEMISILIVLVIK